jgi:hypothetical protein
MVADLQTPKLKTLPLQSQCHHTLFGLALFVAAQIFHRRCSQSAYSRSTMADEATDHEQAGQEAIQHALLARINDALDKALQDEMAIDEAAAILTSPSRCSDIPLDDYAYLLFGVCLNKALKVEPLQPSQQRLVTLLDSLRERPTPAEEQGDYWASLPTFFSQVAGLLNTEGLLESPGDRLPWQRRMAVSEWRNLHGFLAAYYTSLPEGEQESFGYYHQALLLLRHVQICTTEMQAIEPR